MGECGICERDARAGHADDCPYADGKKYRDDGWYWVRKKGWRDEYGEWVPDGERRYTDAMLRHLMREATGEERDPDTGLHHAAHCCWNALARLDLALRKASNA